MLRADGREVAVKVQRPGVASAIALDVYILRQVGRFMRVGNGLYKMWRAATAVAAGARLIGVGGIGYLSWSHHALEPAGLHSLQALAPAQHRPAGAAG